MRRKALVAIWLSSRAVLRFSTIGYDSQCIHWSLGARWPLGAKNRHRWKLRLFGRRRLCWWGSRKDQDHLGRAPSCQAWTLRRLFLIFLHILRVQLARRHFQWSSPKVPKFAPKKHFLATELRQGLEQSVLGLRTGQLPCSVMLHFKIPCCI